LHVRENELSLYGFLDPDEKHLFEALLAVSGVGPKAALSVMSTLSVDTLRRAVLNDQSEVLSRAPGVGKKTAQAIVLHLKDKIKRQGLSGIQMNEDDADVIAALTALGFSVVESQRAIQQLPRDTELSLDEKIRRTLSMLGK
jgi:Holliday junction DNA helicase RuvA